MNNLRGLVILGCLFWIISLSESCSPVSITLKENLNKNKQRYENLLDG